MFEDSKPPTRQGRIPIPKEFKSAYLTTRQLLAWYRRQFGRTLFDEALCRMGANGPPHFIVVGGRSKFYPAEEAKQWCRYYVNVVLPRWQKKAA